MTQKAKVVASFIVSVFVGAIHMLLALIGACFLTAVLTDGYGVAVSIAFFGVLNVIIIVAPMLLVAVCTSRPRGRN